MLDLVQIYAHIQIYIITWPALSTPTPGGGYFSPMPKYVSTPRDTHSLYSGVSVITFSFLQIWYRQFCHIKSSFDITWDDLVEGFTSGLLQGACVLIYRASIIYL